MKKTGLLLVNLGSPDSPSVPDVRRYLREFLMDERVIDSPWPIRAMVVYGAILPFRPKQSAHAYQSVWTPEGSPLITISRKVLDLIRPRFDMPVELAMRYQNPSIPDAVYKLLDAGVEHIVAIPLFPHYAMSSFESAAERVKEAVHQQKPGTEVTIAPPFYEHPDYIDALVQSAAPLMGTGFDHLLFSFHGLPERHMKKGDPTGRHCLQAANCCETPSPARATCYRAQCFATVRAFVKKAGVPKEKYSVAFQSRLGRDPWLKPYTDIVLEELPKQGVKRLQVICPAFVSDCLETIEEIGMRGHESFMKAGGGSFESIPCMNTHPRWIEALETLLRESLPK